MKQVVIGNVYDPSFFDDLKDDSIRESIQKVLRETKEDLDNIIKTLVEHGVDGYIYDLKKDNLKELFQATISDEDMLKNISHNAHLKMETKFSLEKAVITENEDYKKIAN